tara:strand:+ start:167 stop:358 length:192 start_codon:yes stop_codon:yes gene_type:complete
MYNIRGERIDKVGEIIEQLAGASGEEVGNTEITDLVEALYSQYGDSDNIESIIQELVQRRETG